MGFRKPVHKGSSSRKFRKAVSKTHPKNVKNPSRGGFRL